MGGEAKRARESAKLTSVGRGLLSISLDLHATSNSGVGLSAREISHVNEGVVESSQDVADTELVFSLLSSTNDRRSVVNYLLFLGLLAFLAFSCGTLTLLLSLGLQEEIRVVKVKLPYLSTSEIY